jgi:type I restriction enzyme M protein
MRYSRFLISAMEYLTEKYTSPEAVIKDEDGNIHYTGDKLVPYLDHIQKHMFKDLILMLPCCVLRQ